MYQQSIYGFKHVGSFCLLLALSLVRPAAIVPSITISAAPLAVLAAWLLLLFKIQTTLGFKTFFIKYKSIIWLIIAYFLICALSLISNYERYPSVYAFIRWGLTFPITQSAVVATGFLFVLPQNTRGPSLTRAYNGKLVLLVVAIGVLTMAIWQSVDDEGARAIYQYSVAGDLSATNQVVSGFFATSTDLGSAAALILTFSVLVATRSASQRSWLELLLAIVVCGFAVVSGVQSGSRGFFLSIGIGGFVLLYRLLRHRAYLLPITLLPAIFCAVLALQLAPQKLTTKLSPLIPSIIPFSTGMPLETPVFKYPPPRLVVGEDRAILWQRAIDAFHQNPSLGISNGGYRLLNQSLGTSPIHNTHNAFLQLAVDAGAGGVALGFMVLGVIASRLTGTGQMTMLGAVLAGLLVDNFADHSLSWITLAMFTIGNADIPIPKITRQIASSLSIACMSIIATIVVLSMIFIRYFHVKERYESQDFAEQLITSRDYWENNLIDPPTMISKKLSRELGSSRSKKYLNLPSEINTSDWCSYSYEGAKLIHLVSEANEFKYGRYSRPISRLLTISYGSEESCDLSQRDPENLAHWISNDHDYLSKWGLRNNSQEILLITNTLSLFSPVITATEQKAFTLEVRGSSFNNLHPLLRIQFLDATSGDVIAETVREAYLQSRVIEVTLPELASGRGYIRISIDNWQQNLTNNKRQEIIIGQVGIRSK